MIAYLVGHLPMCTALLVTTSVVLAGSGRPRPYSKPREVGWWLGLVVQCLLVVFGAGSGYWGFLWHAVPAAGFAVNIYLDVRDTRRANEERVRG